MWACVPKSSIGFNQRGEVIWDSVQKKCDEKYEMKRTVEAIREKLKPLARECQNHISDLSLVETKFPRGRTSSKSGEQAMIFYSKFSGRKESAGFSKPTPEFTYQERISTYQSNLCWTK